MRFYVLYPTIPHPTKTIDAPTALFVQIAKGVSNNLSNEELAVLIQSGRAELYADLWKQTQRFIAMQARAYFQKFTINGRSQTSSTIIGGVGFDDLCQAGFLGLVKATARYDPDAGAQFITFLSYQLRAAFDECCGLHRGRVITHTDAEGKDRQWRELDPVDTAASLDATIPGGERLTLADIVSDEYNAFETVDEAVYTEQLHAALDAVLDKLPEPEAASLRMKYYQDLSGNEISERLGVSYQYASQLQKNALHHIRTGSGRRQLERFLDENTQFYSGNGYSAFAATQTSPVERKLLHRERLTKTYIYNQQIKEIKNENHY